MRSARKHALCQKWRVSGSEGSPCGNDELWRCRLHDFNFLEAKQAKKSDHKSDQNLAVSLFMWFSCASFVFCLWEGGLDREEKALKTYRKIAVLKRPFQKL